MYFPADSDRNSKKTTKSAEEMLAHNDSDGEKTLKIFYPSRLIL